jgi:hypothetical protein
MKLFVLCVLGYVVQMIIVALFVRLIEKQFRQIRILVSGI